MTPPDAPLSPPALPLEDLEPASCPLCGPDLEPIPRHEFPPYRIVSCPGCGLLFLSPRLSESAILNLYSDQEYFTSPVAGRGYDEYLEARSNWIKTFSRRLDQILKHQAPGKVLDIGCGAGFFLEAAQAKGYDVYGLDPSKYIVHIARQRFGERIRQGVIETADYPPATFDLVVAFDTFEHIYRPLEWLQAVWRILKPGGLLAITTPDPTSLLARLSGRRWVSFKLPEHVFYWSPAAIRRALARNWEVLEITRAGQYATLGFLFRRLFGFPPNLRGPLQSLLNLLNRFSIYSDNGSLTVIARKNGSKRRSP